ncbi:MAG: beta-glucosidase [Acetobacteraceae bacterium]|nr:beta-glucosidase [Acetobacteraceae bacterium]
MNAFRKAAPRPGFLVGGFECASHAWHDGVRVDPLGVTRHDVMAAGDYRLIARAGMRTVREGLRWQRIEVEPGRYDWSSAIPMFEAIAEEGVAAIWDICHWGIPDGIDFFSDSFVARMADFGAAAVEEMTRRGAPPAGIVPVNEMNFWAWAGGLKGYFPPYLKDTHGDAVKRQLVRAYLAVAQRLRPLIGGAPIITCEPLVVVHATPEADPFRVAAEQEGMYQAWDMLLGRLAPELGGHDGAFDWVGVNYYPHNQWEIGHEMQMLAEDDPRRIPLRELLVRVHDRYRMPLMITETGDEEPGCAPWMAMVGREAAAAREAGVDLRGICLYPVMDYPGWADRRHCPCGVIETDADYRERRLRPHVLAALRGIAQEAGAVALTQDAR